MPEIGLPLQEEAASRESDDQMDWQEKYFQKIGEGIADLKAALLRLEDRFDARFEQSENKVNARFGQSESKVNARFDQLENRFENRLRQTETRLEKYIGERDAQRHQEFLALNQRMDEMNKWLIALVITIILGVMGLATGLLPVR
ncbi:MAG: hypothetical protein M1379_16235 [Firmicutes bacterium]|nr:hypothetical protein [Bacillota bacterium]